jgi:hypothetical protein
LDRLLFSFTSFQEETLVVLLGLLQDRKIAVGYSENFNFFEGGERGLA